VPLPEVFESFGGQALDDRAADRFEREERSFETALTDSVAVAVSDEYDITPPEEFAQAVRCEIS
jgi:hypothetical protein